MLVYWLLFIFFAIGSLLRRNSAGRGAEPYFFTVGAVVLVLAIGLRFEVGGDWGAYQRMFAMAGLRDLDQMMRLGDPAYHLLDWAVQQLEWPFWVVNLICAAIFTYGLVRFAREQDDPWLAMLIAIPYLVIVVSMGYTRQAVAIGIIMAGLAAVQRGASVVRFALYVAVAALFHKTAVVALLLVALTGRRNAVLNLLVIAAGGVLLYDSLLQDSMSKLMNNYVSQRYTSQGATIRVAMSIVPAALFLLRRRAFGLSLLSDQLWRNFSIAALILLIGLLAMPSSTAIDRIALYLLPLQMAVLSRVPRVLLAGQAGRLLVVTYAFAIEFVWLNFADNSNYWLPYNNYLWA